MAVQRRRRLSVPEYVKGVLAGNRSVLGRAITLLESTRPADQEAAQQVLQAILPHSGKSYRLGISGVPGVGKSTFIEAFGTNLTAMGHRVAVLAVDPTSGVTGGSILGDKTRMGRLSIDPKAFIRPSPSSGTLGGVARRSRETMLLCEAAGFDIVLVETVGVGQSETVVAEMVDFFLVLMLPGAGDELQGIKRGILEIADLVAVNKSDGENAIRAKQSKNQYRAALHMTRSPAATWQPPVVLCSALLNQGLEQIWSQVQEHRRALQETGEYEEARQRQMVRWLWAIIEGRLMDSFRRHPGVLSALPGCENDVFQGKKTPEMAARELLKTFGVDISTP